MRTSVACVLLVIVGSVPAGAQSTDRQAADDPSTVRALSFSAGSSLNESDETPIPPDAIVRRLHMGGLEPVTDPVRLGSSYLVHAVDRKGTSVLVVLDAVFGDILVVKPMTTPARHPVTSDHPLASQPQPATAVPSVARGEPEFLSEEPVHQDTAGSAPSSVPTVSSVSAVSSEPAVSAISSEISADHGSDQTTALLIKQGEELFANGNISRARLVLERAAEAGDPHAALSLAETYDPLELERLSVRGLRPDVSMARNWYEKAKERGSPEASQRLETMLSQVH